MKHILNSTDYSKLNESIDNTENELIKCGFEKITEKDIPNYTGGNLSSFKSENVYDFGYLSYNDYCIIHLNKNLGDDVLGYEGTMIIIYNNELYIGIYSEGQYFINEEIKSEISIPRDSFGHSSNDWDNFVKEMKNQNIDLFYCVSF